jgi:oligosaccharide repeat unit polymerase
MDVFDKCLALAFSLMILGQAYLVRRYVGTWLFPACLFGLFWFGYTFVPLAILFWVPVQPYATAFLFVCTVAFSMGSLFFDWKTAFVRNGQKRETAAMVYGSSFLKVIFYLSTLASLVFLALNLFAQGFSLHDMLFNLYTSAAAYANLHYSEDLNVHVFNRLSIVFAYLGAILGGFLLPCMPTKIGRRLIVVLSFLPSILVAVTQSANGHLFYCIVFFYAGLLVYRASAGTLRLFEKGSIKSLALGTAMLIAIVTIAFLGRGLYKIEDTEELINELVIRYASYSFGHIYAFSDWFAFIVGRHSELVYRHESAAHGFYTFMAVFNLVGRHKVVPMGVFDDYSYGDWLTTNIFTMFRGLILDFGLIGSVLFMLATGILLHWTFHAMLRNIRPVFTVAVFVLMMSYFYTSFIISVLVFFNIYVTFVLLWMVLQINKLITQTDGRRLARPKPSFGAVSCLPS